MYVTEEMLENSLYSNEAASFNLWHKMLIGKLPELSKAAALEAIKEWGRPVSEITHLVFATSSDRLETPSADFCLAKLLGLSPSVRRHIICLQGCFAGSAFPVARVLVVGADSMLYSFCGPSRARIGMLIGHAIFGDGAAAAIVGADIRSPERPLFRMVSAAQTVPPDSEDAVVGELRASL